MEQAVHTVSSPSRVLLQGHSRGPRTLARVMALQVLRDILLECKDVPLEAWVACPMVLRWDLMDNRDREAMDHRARRRITAHPARRHTRASSNLPIPSPRKDNQVARLPTQGNPILRRLLLHTPK